MKIAVSILGLLVLLGAGLGIYLYTPPPTAAPQPLYSETKKAAMAARAAKQAEAERSEERMIETVSATKASAKNADLNDAINRRN